MRPGFLKWAVDEMMAEQAGTTQQPQPQLPQGPSAGSVPDQEAAQAQAPEGAPGQVSSQVQDDGTGLLNEQRAQELHDQKLRFNEEAHRTKMELERQRVEVARQKMLSDRIKAQNSGNKAPVPTIEELRAMQNNQQQMYRQNLAGGGQPQQQGAPKMAGLAGALRKHAEDYGYDPEWYRPKNPLIPVVAGAALGGGLAHYAFPSEATERYRKLLEKIPDKAVADAEEVYSKGGKVPLKDMIGLEESLPGGKKTRWAMPAHAAKKYLREAAWRTNARRLALGLGVGGGAGYLAYNMLKNDR